MRLGDWLKRNGITHAAFAKRIRVSQGRVSQLAGGNERREALVRVPAETDNPESK